MKKFASIVFCSFVSVVACEKQPEPEKKMTSNEWTRHINSVMPADSKLYPPSIHRKYDKFDKETFFASDALTFDNYEFTLNAYAKGDVQYIKALPETITMSAMRQRNIYDLRFMIDNGDVYAIKKDYKDFLWEHKIPFTLIVKIAHANRVDCRINGQDFEFTAEQRAIFKDFVDIFKP